MKNSPLYTALQSTNLNICSAKREKLFYSQAIKGSSLCLFIVAVVEKPWGRQIFNEVETLSNLWSDQKPYVCFGFLITENKFEETYKRYLSIINDHSFSEGDVLELLQKWSVLKIWLSDKKVETDEPVKYLQDRIQGLL